LVRWSRWMLARSLSAAQFLTTQVDSIGFWTVVSFLLCSKTTLAFFVRRSLILPVNLLAIDHRFDAWMRTETVSRRTTV
jgi:hypothetical protein